MPLVIEAITESQARAASAWRYAGPYAIYDHEPDDWPRFLVPAHRYHAVLETTRCWATAVSARTPACRAAAIHRTRSISESGCGRNSSATATAVASSRRSSSSAAFDMQRRGSPRPSRRSTRALALCHSVGFQEVSRFTSRAEEPREFALLLNSKASAGVLRGAGGVSLGS